MRIKIKSRVFVSLLLTLCLLVLPATAFAKKGDKHFRDGLHYEAMQQWDKAAQEFTLAVAADPSNSEYQLHFRRASFNASQSFMQQGRTLAEQQDFVGAYNAFRQAYLYDSVNELAVSEMERMLRLQGVKDGTIPPADSASKNSEPGSVGSTSAQEAAVDSPQTEMRVISYSGDLKAFIRSLAEQLNLNVIFDRQSFVQPRNIDINLRQVTTAQALDYIFLQESLFFQKLSRRTILVADQTRRPQYQQLVLRTFFLANSDPEKAKQLVGQAIPPSVGRPQTIVVADKDTNSLTIRDTAENVRLIGELIQSIDKDRAEVVMDVNIFEINKTDLMQFGNQLGTDSTLVNLGGIQKGFSVLQGGAGTVGLPVALGSALLIPSSQLIALQTKNRGKLVASTQVHAFNGEESTARIGQRVPVQTAQAYPFGVQTSTGTTNNGFPTGGFPVINYEPTGLTLKFTPQVFPNQDVQVKMSIEAKDVIGATTLTPTFTERTITGTARVQNNKTMMLASVTTEVQSNGRKGLPILSGLPWLGRMFSAPTSDDRVVDIVIAVTPRVLRAPAVTPRDLEMRPSGTLQSPTTGSLEAMLREADREDQLAELRRQQKNATAKVDMPAPQPVSPAVFGNAVPTSSAVAVTTPAPTTAANDAVATSAQKNSGIGSTAATQTAANTTPVNTTAANTTPVNTTTGKTTAGNTTPVNTTTGNTTAANTTPVNTTAGKTTAANTTPANTTAGNTTAANISSSREELPAYVPAPKSLVSSSAATQVAAVNTNIVSDARANLASMAAKPIEAAISPISTKARTAQLTFGPADQSMMVGETRRFALDVKSDVPLAMAIVALRFDPKVVRVRAIELAGSRATLTQSTDASGVCLVSISGLSGTWSQGTLIYVEVEGISPGDGGLAFDKESSHLVAVDARDLGVEVTPARASVKQ